MNKKEMEKAIEKLGQNQAHLVEVIDKQRDQIILLLLAVRKIGEGKMAEGLATLEDPKRKVISVPVLKDWYMSREKVIEQVSSILKTYHGIQKIVLEVGKNPLVEIAQPLEEFLPGVNHILCKEDEK